MSTRSLKMYFLSSVFLVPCSYHETIFLFSCFDCPCSFVIVFSCYRLVASPLNSKAFWHTVYLFFFPAVPYLLQRKLIWGFLFIIHLNDCFPLEIDFAASNLILFLWLWCIFWLRFDYDAICVVT